MQQARRGAIYRARMISVLFVFFLAFSTPASAKDFEIRNDANSFMYVSGTTGNVGINSSVPQQKLDVAGGMVVSGQATVGTLAFTSGNTANDITTTVNASSTNGQLPTAAAVYTSIISGGSTIIQDANHDSLAMVRR